MVVLSAHVAHKVGSTLPVSETTVESMANFTIKYVYKDNVSKTLAEARATKWKAMKKKSTLRIPPAMDSHRLKVERAIYQTYTSLNYNRPDSPPSPLGHGWILNAGKCEPLRHTKPALPQTLNNLIAERRSPTESTDSDSDDSTDTEEEEEDIFTDI